MAPDSEHYLGFDDLYGKVQITEKDCPSLGLMVSQKKKLNSNFKFIASRVVAVLQSSPCGKVHGVFNMSPIITVDRERDLDDLISSISLTSYFRAISMTSYFRAAESFTQTTCTRLDI